MDKTRVWSSMPACSRVNETTARSGMVVKDEAAQTQTRVVPDSAWAAPRALAPRPRVCLHARPPCLIFSAPYLFSFMLILLTALVLTRVPFTCHL